MLAASFLIAEWLTIDGRPLTDGIPAQALARTAPALGAEAVKIGRGLAPQVLALAAVIAEGETVTIDRPRAGYRLRVSREAL